MPTFSNRGLKNLRNKNKIDTSRDSIIYNRLRTLAPIYNHNSIEPIMQRSYNYHNGIYVFENGDTFKIKRYYDSYYHEDIFYPTFKKEHKFLGLFKYNTWHILPGRWHESYHKLTPRKIPFITNRRYLFFDSEVSAIAWLIYPNHTVENIVNKNNIQFPAHI